VVSCALTPSVNTNKKTRLKVDNMGFIIDHSSLIIKKAKLKTQTGNREAAYMSTRLCA
jgi:hypothetical protein